MEEMANNIRIEDNLSKKIYGLADSIESNTDLKKQSYFLDEIKKSYSELDSSLIRIESVMNKIKKIKGNGRKMLENLIELEILKLDLQLNRLFKRVIDVLAKKSLKIDIKKPTELRKI
jgi:2C-methyl-D-erythritol 2,4-cyclodiphosphate synthase